MATEGAHLLKAANNQQFLDTIDDAFPDWLLTVGFYKAVHLAEALFARSAVHSQNHGQRNARLRAQHPKLWIEYKPLYDSSKLVRYSPRSMPAALVRTEYLGKRLVNVERLVNAELAVPDTTAPAPKPASENRARP